MDVEFLFCCARARPRLAWARRGGPLFQQAAIVGTLGRRGWGCLPQCLGKGAHAAGRAMLRMEGCLPQRPGKWRHRGTARPPAKPLATIVCAVPPCSGYICRSHALCIRLPCAHPHSHSPVHLPRRPFAYSPSCTFIRCGTAPRILLLHQRPVQRAQRFGQATPLDAATADGRPRPRVDVGRCQHCAVRPTLPRTAPLPAGRVPPAVPRHFAASVRSGRVR